MCPLGDDWVQVGIASFTSAKRPGDVPGAFTRVSAYIQWLIETIVRNTDLPTQAQRQQGGGADGDSGGGGGGGGGGAAREAAPAESAQAQDAD